MLIPFHCFIHLLVWGCCYSAVYGQNAAPPSSAPNPNAPTTPYSTDWQTFFNVTDPLPNVSFQLGRNFAGNIGVNREGHPNNTLFFWAWESAPGSLTNRDTTSPWVIWLNGGPGSSSLLGLFVENGPIHITTGTSPTSNRFSWDKLADTIWIDQPVGTGWATADSDAYAADEEQIAEDFVNFLSNLVQVFPNLSKRPLHLAGESYAGTYIPYIAKALYSMSQPPVSLKKLAMGNALLGTYSTQAELPVPYVLETFPQLINYDPRIFNYFKTQSSLCGYNITLSYPQTGGIFPTLRTTAASDPASPYHTSTPSAPILWKRGLSREETLKPRVQQTVQRRQSSSPLSGRGNGTIDSWYGCWLFEEMWEMALNFSLPWANNPSHSFNLYDTPDALDPDVPLNPSQFINDNQTRTAAHAPLNQWNGQPPFGSYPFGSNIFAFDLPGRNPWGDPSAPPISFLSELMANSSQHGVSVILYSGNDDSYISHFGTQILIQNTTFGGIQGFTQKPSTPWTDDDGNYAGLVHQERGLTYALFEGAGHQVPYYSPQHAFVFLREFILGNNNTGSLNGRAVVGGSNPSLADIVQTAASALFTGAGATQGRYLAPSATIASWEKYIATASVGAAAQPRGRGYA